MSKESNVSRATIAALESGNEVISTTETLKKLADDLDRKIVTDVYVDNVSIEVTAAKVFCTENTLKRRINEIMINF